MSNQEEKIVKRIKRAKLFPFFREIRHLLFDETFQSELSQMYAEADKGHPPVPPAQLAMKGAILLARRAGREASPLGLRSTLATRATFGSW